MHSRHGTVSVTEASARVDAPRSSPAPQHSFAGTLWIPLSLQTNNSWAEHRRWAALWRTVTGQFKAASRSSCKPGLLTHTKQRPSDAHQREAQTVDPRLDGLMTLTLNFPHFPHSLPNQKRSLPTDLHLLHLHRIMPALPRFTTAFHASETR